MEKNLIIILMFWFFIAAPEGLVKAQNISTAVMEIKAEVISGASFMRNDGAGFFSISGEEVSFGEFTLSIPEGTEIITYSPGTVEMASGSNSWNMQTEMENSRTGDGTINIRFLTRATSSGLHKKLYQGVQIATIEYL